MLKSIPLCALILTTLSTLALADPVADRIRYDNQCYTINGKDTVLYSGAFHYFRCPKPLWADRLQRFKDAGINTVETYVAWNWHEQQPPADVDDFSKIDMSDLTDFLDLAINKYGLYVILRPGPYICAEWDGGGYPQWLVTKRLAGTPVNWLRSDDPTYLAWCKHWMTAVAKASAPYQITHQPEGKPGVILWQIENEYNYAKFPADVKLHQLVALAHDSRDAGIDVPLITCMTNDPLFSKDPYLQANVVECRNTYPKFNPSGELKDLTLLEKYQSDKPRVVTELQGGWFSDVGKQLSGDMGYTAAQITHVTELAWAHGFTGTSYYMMYGGTNLGDWGAASKTTTYDYAAPIREWGGIGDRFYAVEGMATFVKEHGEQLARSTPETVQFDTAPANLSVVSRLAKDGSRFLFIMNDQAKEPASGDFHLTAPVALDVHYDLDAYGAKILYLSNATGAQPQWVATPAAGPQRPAQVPAATPITEARRMVDPGPPDDSWKSLPDGDQIEDVGIFDRRFVFYRAEWQGTEPTVITGYLPRQDSLLAQVNGNQIPVHRGTGGVVSADVAPSGGSVLLLYENGGRDNGGDGMNAKCGPHLLAVKSGATVLPVHWLISGESTGSAGKWWEPSLDDSSWSTEKLADAHPTSSTAIPVNLSWYRMNFELPASDPHLFLPWKLHMGASGNGQIYLNGHYLGRWWEVGPQTDFYLPECWLNFGPGAKNNVTLALRPTTGEATLKSAEVSPYADFAEVR
jgi:hypothetical protein